MTGTSSSASVISRNSNSASSPLQSSSSALSIPIFSASSPSASTRAVPSFFSNTTPFDFSDSGSTSAPIPSLVTTFESSSCSCSSSPSTVGNRHVLAIPPPDSVSLVSPPGSSGSKMTGFWSAPSTIRHRPAPSFSSVAPPSSSPAGATFWSDGSATIPAATLTFALSPSSASSSPRMNFAAISSPTSFATISSAVSSSFHSTGSGLESSPCPSPSVSSAAAAAVPSASAPLLSSLPSAFVLSSPSSRRTFILGALGHSLSPLHALPSAAAVMDSGSASSACSTHKDLSSTVSHRPSPLSIAEFFASVSTMNDHTVSSSSVAASAAASSSSLLSDSSDSSSLPFSSRTSSSNNPAPLSIVDLPPVLSLADLPSDIDLIALLSSPSPHPSQRENKRKVAAAGSSSSTSPRVSHHGRDERQTADLALQSSSWPIDADDHEGSHNFSDDDDDLVVHCGTLDYQQALLTSSSFLRTSGGLEDATIHSCSSSSSFSRSPSHSAFGANGSFSLHLPVSFSSSLSSSSSSFRPTSSSLPSSPKLSSRPPSCSGFPSPSIHPHHHRFTHCVQSSSLLFLSLLFRSPPLHFWHPNGRCPLLLPPFSLFFLRRLLQLDRPHHSSLSLSSLVDLLLVSC